MNHRQSSYKQICYRFVMKELYAIILFIVDHENQYGTLKFYKSLFYDFKRCRLDL